MKLPRGGSAAQLIAAPKSSIRVVLFFGEDGGLAREQAKAAVVAVAGDAGDPFRVVELSGALLKADPARLADEAAQISFTGGRRAIWIRDAADGTTAAAVTAFLDDPAGDGVIVLEAGELTNKSKLRVLAEDHPLALAVPCYHDNVRDLDRVIRETLGQHGLDVAPDAVEYLKERMGGDRMVSRGELDKLALYAQGQGRVELADAEAAVGDSAVQSVGDLVAAAAEGRTGDLDKSLSKALLDGESPVGIVRVLIRHFQRLHLVASLVATGKPLEAAMNSLIPRPFKRDAEALARQVPRWPAHRAAAALNRLLEVERQCKTTGLPDETVCARALLEISENARRGRR